VEKNIIINLEGILRFQVTKMMKVLPVWKKFFVFLVRFVLLYFILNFVTVFQGLKHWFTAILLNRRLDSNITSVWTRLIEWYLISSVAWYVKFEHILSCSSNSCIVSLKPVAVTWRLDVLHQVVVSITSRSNNFNLHGVLLFVTMWLCNWL
jgi:hypothetical protein